MSNRYNPNEHPQDPHRDPNQYPENPYAREAGNTGYGQEPQGYEQGYTPQTNAAEGQQYLQPDYASREAGYPGYGMGAGYDNGETTYGYAQPQGVQENNGLALAALILGILSIPAILTVFGGIILGVIAIILGIVGIRKAKSIVGPGARKGMAVTGLVLGLIAAIASAAMFAFGAFFAQDLVEECGEFQNDQERFEQCIDDAVDRKIEDSVN